MNIGMIGTRFAGLDGVTLESIKVAEVLESMGHRVSWFAGQLDDSFVPGVEYPPAFFGSTANERINGAVFGVRECDPDWGRRIEDAVVELSEAIDEWSQGVDVVMPQNALAIPMQIPLGVAIARWARRTNRPVLAHHHDFAWERDRFWPNAINGYLEEAFPPTGARIGHLVINTLARDALKERTGADALVLPNVMDFAHPPPAGDGALFRRHAAIPAENRILLQPTRMVPRKGIEDTLELAARLGADLSVVVTHPEPDEGSAYVETLTALAGDLGIDLRIVPAVPPVRLADAYAAADLVCYPSRIEGFGNALLEAAYYRKPLLVNRYPVYVADIGPAGLQAIEMDGEMTSSIVAAARHWIEEPEAWTDAVEHNYGVCRDHFSYEKATRVLTSALASVQ